MLMLQSRQGLVLIIGLLVIWLVYSKRNKILQKTQKLQEGTNNDVSTTEATDNMDPMIADVQRALEGFSSAMAEYAYHLKSHIGVMINLDQTTKQLKELVHDQTMLFTQMDESLESIPEPENTSTEDIPDSVKASDNTTIASN